MAYTTVNKSSDFFNTHLYSGNDTTNNQQVGLTPDLVWVKCRNNAIPSHYLVDKVRGDKKYISSNATTAEQTDSNTFDLVSGGFNLAGGNGWTNVTGRNYVAWNWKANGAGVSNTDGSITSTVSANTTSGFSIVKYTASSSASTIGHGLGVKPKIIMQKNLDASGNWGVYHENIGATKFLALNTTDAEATNSTPWNDTEPTTLVFSIGSGYTNGNDYIAYCFAEKKGFSKFGSYTGNGSTDGTFLYTGFKPAWLIIKRTDSADSWFMYDNKRNSFNVIDDYLIASSNTAETNSASVNMDFLSNGVKIRNIDGGHNASGGTYIFMAFAEAPLVGSNNVPCTAR